MRIIGQTNDELLLFSPATGSRLMSGLMLAVGGLFFLLAVAICLACLGVPVIAKPVGGFWSRGVKGSLARLLLLARWERPRSSLGLSGFPRTTYAT